MTVMTNELRGKVFDDRVEYPLGPITKSILSFSIFSIICGFGVIIYTFLYCFCPGEFFPLWPILVFVLGTVGFWRAYRSGVKRGDWLSVKIFKKAENRPEPVYEIHYENRMFASGTFSPEHLSIDTIMDYTSRPISRTYRLLFNSKNPALAEHPQLKNALILDEDKNPARCTEQLTLLLKELGFDPHDIGVLVRNAPK